MQTLVKLPEQDITDKVNKCIGKNNNFSNDHEREYTNQLTALYNDQIINGPTLNSKLLPDSKGPYQDTQAPLIPTPLSPQGRQTVITKGNNDIIESVADLKSYDSHADIMPRSSQVVSEKSAQI